MIKWKLTITTLPFVAAVLLVVLVRDALQFKGIVEFNDISPILTPVALIIGFMMAGVMTDYKESEKIPGEISSTLETIGDTISTVNALCKDGNVRTLNQQYIELVKTVDDWLIHKIETDKCYKVLHAAKDMAPIMHQAAGVNYAIRFLGELNNLRRLISRIDVIGRTSFIKAGYALLEIMVMAAIVLLLVANYKSQFIEYLLVAFLSFIYIYLVRLIHDLDNPFDYKPNGKWKGANEIELFPVRESKRRIVSAYDIRNELNLPGSD